MPTFLEQFADAEIKVRYKEPLLTAGLDQMLTGITPQGVHRGFRLEYHGTNYKVKVAADPADNDHIAAYTTADGYTLRLRRTGGDFDLDLTAFDSKEVVIAIFAEYATAVTTYAEIRAYEYDPTDEFSGAAERPELIVLGKVTVPSGGAIASTDIRPTFRTLAWDHVGSDAMPWEQVVENGNFELAAGPGSFVAADRGYVPHWDTQYLLPQHSWSIDSSNPYVGQYDLRMEGTGVTTISIIPTDRIIAVQPGQLLRVSYWIRGESWPTIGAAGSMGVQLNFYGANLSYLNFRVAQDKALNGTFTWTRIDQYIEVPDTPSGIAWCVPSIVVYDLPTPAAVGQALAFDDIRIWVENGPPTIPYSSIQDGLTNGGHVVGQLGIAEANVIQFGITQNLSTFVQGILQIHKFDNITPGINRYRWRRLDDEPFVHRLQEGALQLTGIVDTEEEAEFPRISMETADGATCYYTNLLQALSEISGWAGLRIYGQLWGTGSTTAMLIVQNASWDQSLFAGSGGWNLDDSTENASLLYITNDGAMELYYYDQSGGTPFDFFGWVKIFGVNLNTDLNLIKGPLVPKAWARFQAGLGSVTIHKEEGISNIVVNGVDSKILDITLDDTIEDSRICAVGTSFFISHIVNLSETGPNTLQMEGYSAAGSYQIDFAGATSNYSIVVLGREA